jgi:hypothetical protein
LAAAQIQSMLVWQRRVFGTIAFDGVRTSASATLFSIDRRGLPGSFFLLPIGLPALRQDGISLGVAYRLDPNNSLGGGIQVYRNTESDAGLESRVRVGQVSYNRQISLRTNGSLLLRRTQQSDLGMPKVPDETAAIAVIETRF